MGLLEKLKSLFGSDQSGQSPARATEADVTVEHEPAAESEHAVKGTDAGRQQHGGQHGTQPQTAAGTAEESGETEQETSASTPDETPDDTEDATAEAADSDGKRIEDATDGPSTEEIKGIGPTYAERLAAAGIGTIADLAAADPADVAEAAETGENRAGDWVERAQDF
jgi:predicted flap endonuclease-1-like 5' DNA nuclease